MTANCLATERKSEMKKTFAPNGSYDTNTMNTIIDNEKE